MAPDIQSSSQDLAIACEPVVSAIKHFKLNFTLTGDYIHMHYLLLLLYLIFINASLATTNSSNSDAERGRKPYDGMKDAMNEHTNDLLDSFKALYDMDLAEKLSNEPATVKTAKRYNRQRATTFVTSTVSGTATMIDGFAKGNVKQGLEGITSLVSVMGPAGAIVGGIGSAMIGLFMKSGPSETELLRREMNTRFDRLESQIGDLARQIQESFNLVFDKLGDISHQLDRIENKIDELPDKLKREIDIGHMENLESKTRVKTKAMMVLVSRYINFPTLATANELDGQCSKLNEYLGRIEDVFVSRNNVFRLQNNAAKDKVVLKLLNDLVSTGALGSVVLSYCYGITAKERDHMFENLYLNRKRLQNIKKWFNMLYGWTFAIGVFVTKPVRIRFDKFESEIDHDIDMKTVYSESFNLLETPNFKAGSRKGFLGQVDGHKCDGKLHKGDTKSNLEFEYVYKCKQGSDTELKIPNSVFPRHWNKNESISTEDMLEFLH